MAHNLSALPVNRSGRRLYRMAAVLPAFATLLGLAVGDYQSHAPVFDRHLSAGYASNIDEIDRFALPALTPPWLPDIINRPRDFAGNSRYIT